MVFIYGALAASLAGLLFGLKAGHSASFWNQWIGAVVLGFGLAWTTVRIHSLTLKLVVAAVALVETAALSYLLQLGGVQWLPNTALAAGALATCFGLAHSMSKAGRRRRKLEEVFGGRLSPVGLQKVLESNETFSLAGEKREASVVECQLVNRRELAAMLPVPDFVALSNAFFSVGAQGLRDSGGVLLGTGAEQPRALFGAPLTDPAHAAQAAEAARTLEERFVVFRQECLEGWNVEPDCRISVHSGPMIFGLFGSGTFDVVSLAG